MASMKIFLAILSCFLGSECLFAADPILGMAEHGKFELKGEKMVFVPDAERNAQREKNSGLDNLRQWHVIGAELQAPKPHRPDETILIGGVGHFNIGMLAPYAGIPIFMAAGDARPTLVGMTDANGKFAIKLPRIEDKSELHLFFSGEISISRHPFAKGEKRVSLLGGEVVEGYDEMVLKLGSPTERFRVSIPIKPASP